MLSHYLRQDSQIFYNSTGDADTMIVKCALDLAAQGNEVTVVADDTDILVLLIYHWKINMATLYFKSEAKKMMWKVQDLIATAGELLTSHILLFMHGVVVTPHLPRLDKAKHFCIKKFMAKGLKSYNTYHQYFPSPK